MTGFTTHTKKSVLGEGVVIYQGKDRIFLDKIEACMLAKLIQTSRVKCWKRFRLPIMKEQKIGDEINGQERVEA